MTRVLEHYKHAKSNFNNKKKEQNKKAQAFVLTDEEGDTVYFQAEHDREKLVDEGEDVADHMVTEILATFVVLVLDS